MYIEGAYTPPLSPSGNSPNSPFSMHSPIDINLELERPLSSNHSVASRTPPPVTPVPSQSPPIPDRLSPPDYALPQTPADEIMSLFARESDPGEIVVRLEEKPREKGPRSSDGSNFGGLAYADSDSDYDDGNDASKKGGIQFPTSSPRSSKSSESAYSTRIPLRTLSSASSSYPGYGARSTTRSTGALDRAMETLFEDTPLSPPTTNASFSPLSPTKHIFPSGTENHNPARDSSSKPPKLPTRSHTSPNVAKPRELDILKPSKSVTSNSSASSSRSRKVKQCASCNKTADDGRWISMDGGRVLCDKCWKNMYLPKVCVAHEQIARFI